MRKFLIGLAGFVLAVVHSLCWAQADETAQWFTEWQRLEREQSLSPDRAVRYADRAAGAMLVGVLNPGRTRAMFREYMQSVTSGRNPPDVHAPARTLMLRYDKAFLVDPAAYEAEYLDSLDFFVSIWESVVSSSRVPPDPAASSRESKEAQALIPLLNDFTQSLSGPLAKLLAQGVRQRVSAGMFSRQGGVRALYLADAMDPPDVASVEAARSAGWPARKLLEGRQVYNEACLVCHQPGIANAPRLGDGAAWASRLSAGLPALVQSTLYGKGAMSSMRGRGYTDLEIARAVVSLVNASGGDAAEPKLPDGQPDLVLMPAFKARELPAAPPPPGPFSSMTAEQRFRFGERLYAANCAMCHQPTGIRLGPIPALAGAPILSNGGKLVDVLLNGAGKGSMPAWKHLGDDEIAAVIFFIRAKFGIRLQAAAVQAEDVKRQRK